MENVKFVTTGMYLVNKSVRVSHSPEVVNAHHNITCGAVRGAR